MKIVAIFKKIVNEIEDSNLPISYFVFTFFFALTLRTFLEFFSDRSEIRLPMLLHYYFFFVAVGLSVILLVHLLTKENIIKVFKIVSTSFIIIIVTPIVDLILSKGAGFDIGYYRGDLIYGFLTFFGKFNDGISLGMRVEIVLFILLLFLYFRLKKVNFLKSFMGILMFYCLVFCYFVTQVILENCLELFGITFVYSSFAVLNVFLFLIIFLFIILSFLLNQKIFLSIFRDLRFSRLFYFWLMPFFGLLLSWKMTGGISLDSESVFYLPFILISILFAWLFSVITNNIIDVDIDKISNKNRPLIKAEIDINTYKKIAWLVLTISLGYALAINFKVFFLILFFIGNYFLYSIPPLRIKRLFFFSKLIILLNSLALIILGYVAFYNDLNILDFLNAFINLGSNTNHFYAITIIFAIFFLVMSNFIDIKDYEGDKTVGIKTLPTIFGLRISKLLIGASSLILYIIVGFLLKNKIMLAGSIIIGCFEFWLINRKKYQEECIFAVYLASLMAILFVVF